MSTLTARSEDAVVAAVDDAAAAGADAAALGDDLFGVVSVLDSEPTLRRSVSEPAIATEAKKQLVSGVFHGRISDPAEQVLTTAVEQRWSHAGALADALEHAGVVSHVIAAEQADKLDDLEDELFRFGRIVDGSSALRIALSDRRAPVEAKRNLIATLTRAKVTPATEHLLERAVSGRGRPFALQLEDFQKQVAARRNRLLATVRVASPLSDEQQRLLGAALESQYGHAVHLNVIVDPEVLGGVRVNIGDEVIDSTIATRLAEARRRLAG